MLRKDGIWTLRRLVSQINEKLTFIWELYKGSGTQQQTLVTKHHTCDWTPHLWLNTTHVTEHHTCDWTPHMWLHWTPHLWQNTNISQWLTHRGFWIALLSFNAMQYNVSVLCDRFCLVLWFWKLLSHYIMKWIKNIHSFLQNLKDLTVGAWTLEI